MKKNRPMSDDAAEAIRRLKDSLRGAFVRVEEVPDAGAATQPSPPSARSTVASSSSERTSPFPTRRRRKRTSEKR